MHMIFELINSDCTAVYHATKAWQPSSRSWSC